jgi:hypothetical protein
MGLRLLTGRSPLPWFATWRIALAASDIDAESAVAAVWLAKRPRWLSPRDYVCLYEHDGSGWQWVGGSRGPMPPGPMRGSRPLSVVVHERGSASRSYTDRLTSRSPGSPLTAARWVASAMYHVPASVTHLVIDGRHVIVPDHGHAIVVWKAPPSTRPPLHPHIVATGQDGSRLAEFGPSDHFDSRTIMGLTEAVE